MSCPGDNYVVPGANPCNQPTGVEKILPGTPNVSITGTATEPIVNVALTSDFIITTVNTANQTLTDIKTGYLQQSGEILSVNNGLFGTITVTFPIPFTTGSIPFVSISPTVTPATNEFTVTTISNAGFVANIPLATSLMYRWCAIGYNEATPPTGTITVSIPNTANQTVTIAADAFFGEIPIPPNYIWGENINLYVTLNLSSLTGGPLDPFCQCNFNFGVAGNPVNTGNFGFYTVVQTGVFNIAQTNSTTDLAFNVIQLHFDVNQAGWTAVANYSSISAVFPVS